MSKVNKAVEDRMNEAYVSIKYHSEQLDIIEKSTRKRMRLLSELIEEHEELEKFLDNTPG